MPLIFETLKKRKLTQWAIAYLAAAFLVAQLLDLVVEPWGFSSTVVQGVQVVLAFGFPLTLVLAWYHGERGRQRVSGAELLMVAALLVIAGVTLSTLVQSTPVDPEVPESDGRPAIAVLPFEDFSPEASDAYFAPGMHEEIISKLSRISGLRVIPRNSVMRYRDDPKETSQVASELAVHFLMEGSARIAQGRVNLRVRLISAARNEPLWEREFDQDLSIDSLVSVQRQIAQEVARSMRVIVTPEENVRLGTNPTENAEAYRSYLLGRLAWARRRGGGIREAIEHFERAIREDPLFARAYAGLADAYVVLPFYERYPELPSNEVWARAKSAANRAVQLDDGLSEAHVSAAAVKMYFDWDWEGAEAEFERAIALNRNNPWAHHWYGWLLVLLGRHDVGISRLKDAQHLDPFSVIINRNLGDAMYRAGRYEEALAQYQRTAELEPSESIRRAFAGVHTSMGNYELALEYDSLSQTGLRALVALGRRDEARAIASSRQNPTGRQRLNDAVALHDAETVLPLLTQALEAREPWLVGTNESSNYDFLRADPRFQDLMRRMGLRQRGG